MQFTELANARRSVRTYDTTQPVSDADLKAIFHDVVLSPSAFNLQQWAFVVVRDPENRKKMRAAAMDQVQVENCGAVVVVCGKLNADEDVDTIYAQAPDKIRQRIGGICGMIYGQGEQMRRDEAIRGASLAAMSLMYSAKAKGFETGAMIGYDPEQVADLAGLPSNYIPVMMVVMGRGGANGMPRAGRRPLSEVVKLESFSAGGLS